jgi:hypothetical protein
MSIEAFVVRSREFLLHGFRMLPIIIAAFSFIIGIGQANMAFFFLFLGVAFIVPVTNMILNPIVGALFGLGVPEYLFKIKGSGVGCPVFGEFANAGDTVSLWLASLVFFVTYFFINAYNLYNRPSDPGAPDYKVDARQTQALMAMAIILLFGIAMLLYRFFLTQGCESPLGMPVALLTFIPLAYYWYQYLVNCSGDRLTDLFGVANRIMVEPSSAGPGAVCLPVA